MPNLNSAKKALRQNKTRYIRNKNVRERIKRWTKKLLGYVEKGEKEKAIETFGFLTKLLDKAGKRNVMHKNKANRQKSHLQKKLNAL